VVQEEHKAYLWPHFEQDVFVSYSHGDPLGTGILKKWTLDLVGTLEGHRDTHPEFGGLAIWKTQCSITLCS
jgi:hypothetical protein